MTEYTYRHRAFEKKIETIKIPDDAIGISVDYFGDLGTVQYLVPTGDRCPDCGFKDFESTGAGKQCQTCGWHAHG